jgi:hypothetical protein
VWCNVARSLVVRELALRMVHWLVGPSVLSAGVCSMYCCSLLNLQIIRLAYMRSSFLTAAPLGKHIHLNLRVAPIKGILDGALLALAVRTIHLHGSKIFRPDCLSAPLLRFHF